MDFMKKALDDSKQIWDDCVNTRFICEMADNTLSREKFFDYIVQDSIYLRDYLKVFAYAIVKADKLKDMQLFYSLLGYVNDGENVTRLNYLKDFGMTDEDVDKAERLPECKAYCDFLIETSRENGIEEIIMAMLPCMLGYQYVFEKLKEKSPQVLNGCYAPLVKDYTSEEYKKSCDFWIETAQQRCGCLSEERQTELIGIFRQASLHELFFWRMAGREK